MVQNTTLLFLLHISCLSIYSRLSTSKGKASSELALLWLLKGRELTEQPLTAASN